MTNKKHIHRDSVSNPHLHNSGRLRPDMWVFSCCVLFGASSMGWSANETLGDSRAVSALRVEEHISIDGDLAEASWKLAERADSFYRAERTRGVPAEMRTEAMVLYDDSNIYVGFRCFEQDMSRLRETLTRRDTRVWHDDAVEIVLDTYDDNRNGYIFGVNTLGTQMDQHVSNESVFTFTWDAQWSAQVMKHEDSWTVEFAIPFDELRFDAENTRWGINFWRAHPLDGEAYSWSDTGGDFGRISEFGDLHGLHLADASGERKVGVLPYMTYRALEELPDDRDLGIDLLFPSTTFSANITMNPDFSQLESDPTQIDVTSDRELSLPERRPFFREDADLFSLPLNLFYSRRVQEIDFGAKSAGKYGNYNYALLNSYGRIVDRYDDGRKRRANLLNIRVNRDLGDRAVVGLMGIQKHQADRDVSLLSMNSRLSLRRDWSTQLQYVVNHVEGDAHWAYHTSTRWTHERGWFGDASLEEIQNGFRPNETGLEDEAYRKWTGQVGYRHEYPEESTLKSYRLSSRYFHQTNEEKKLRERYTNLHGSLEIGRVDLTAVGRIGKQRDDDALFGRRELNLQASYSSTWSNFVVFSKFGRRQNSAIRQSDVSANANLFEKITLDFFGGRVHWHGHRKTWFARINGNYQFTRKIGTRVYLEGIDERLEDEVDYNFNWVFDYEFTPESHFFLVFVRDQENRRAMFTKLAYLFDSTSIPPFGRR